MAVTARDAGAEWLAGQAIREEDIGPHLVLDVRADRTADDRPTETACERCGIALVVARAGPVRRFCRSCRQRRYEEGQAR
jgi:hypothetical protein